MEQISPQDMKEQAKSASIEADFPKEPQKKSRLQTVFRLLQSAPVFGLVLLVFATSFAPFDALTDVNLSAHMLQHVLISAAGVMMGYPLYRSGKLDRLKSARFGLLGLAVLAALVIFWHLPANWDAAVLNLDVHIVEHVCFLAVGLLIGIVIPMFPDNIKVILALLGISSHMFYGFALYVITTPIYPVYPVGQQADLGLALFAPTPLYIGAYLYINLTRESRKIDKEMLLLEERQGVRSGTEELANLALSKSRATVKEAERKSSLSPWKMIVVALSLLMIFSLVGYYAITAVAITGSTPVQNPSASYVYIVEGPITWQYSPQNITVVIGVNNTVTWISHSFTTDTVTSLDGSFSSGPIGPGQSFSHTFSQPGIYRYYCVYHQWMSGTISVVSA